MFPLSPLATMCLPFMFLLALYALEALATRFPLLRDAIHGFAQLACEKPAYAAAAVLAVSAGTGAFLALAAA